MPSKKSRKNKRGRGSRAAPAIIWTDPFLIPLWIGKWLLYRAVSTPTLLSLARLWGGVLYRFRHRSQQLRKQLQLHFGPSKSPAEINAIGRRHFQYLQEARIVRIWPQRRDFDALEFQIEGREYLEEALAEGKGVILLTVHFAYGRMIKHILRRLGRESSTVGMMGEGEGLEGWSRFRYLVHTRILGIPMFRAEADNELPTGINIRPIMNALRDNRCLIMAADGRNAVNFVTVPLFGKQRTFATGSVSIAAATGVPILPTFVVDSKAGGRELKLLLKPPLPVDPTNRPAEVRRTFEVFSKALESVVLDYPHLQEWKRLKYWQDYDYEADLKREIAPVAEPQGEP